MLIIPLRFLFLCYLNPLGCLLKSIKSIDIGSVRGYLFV
uniref:Uncharacterized protein n=1 Tax=Rhizophora mucronata TaxID=61149 RepID=A0A2P2QQ46_RHIMU